MIELERLSVTIRGCALLVGSSRPPLGPNYDATQKLGAGIKIPHDFEDEYCASSYRKLTTKKTSFTGARSTSARTRHLRRCIYVGGLSYSKSTRSHNTFFTYGNDKQSSSRSLVSPKFRLPVKKAYGLKSTKRRRFLMPAILESAITISP